MRVRTLPILIPTLAVLAVRPASAAAQEDSAFSGSRPGWSLERTMREFARALGGDAPGFFPARGDWTWVVTRRYPEGRDRPTVWRFPAAQTDSAMAPGGPVCDSFHSGDSVMLGTLADAGDGPWRRVRGTRFVAPGRAAGSPVWVEWRREDGRWVVSAYGEEAGFVPRLPGRDAAEVASTRGDAPLRLPLPADAPVAAGAAWYESNAPIRVAGQRMTRWGLPRPLRDGEVVRYSKYEGVALYVEPEVRGIPRTVWVPVDRAGIFQQYVNQIGNGCET
ncbi:hypothetical protein [Longimicrobium sp.]|uniref:hypothetical protein n=1 Tax=Longimicrobium sp. TaxID=2029185 RepID=UPI002B77588D|nr:hypothetical protein [Longimicrobium sp.]HSU13859.1 hypothetical protein [Longimicrobium sp.]